jgi:recombination protein RecA
MVAKKKKSGKTAKKTIGNKDVRSLDVAREDIRRKFGNIFGKLEDKELVIPTISSGCLGLDIALGRGGFARGRIYEVYGPPSGGKTTLAMSVIAQAQKRGLSCLFCDAERAADPKLFSAMGVNNSELEIVRGKDGDDNLEAVETYLKSKEINVVVIDSVSALIPKAEADAGINDDFMGLLARLMSKAMRRLVPKVDDSDALLIFVNQIREKINTYGDPTTTTGGRALNFYSTGRVLVSGGEYKSSRIVDDMTGEVVGHVTNFEVKKNKLSAPYRCAKIPLIYGVGYDSHWEVLNLSVDLGIVDKAGSWFSYKDRKLGQGEINVRDLLVEDDELYKELREEVIIRTGLKQHYEQNS